MTETRNRLFAEAFCWYYRFQVAGRPGDAEAAPAPRDVTHRFLQAAYLAPPKLRHWGMVNASVWRWMELTESKDATVDPIAELTWFLDENFPDSAARPALPADIILVKTRLQLPEFPLAQIVRQLAYARGPIKGSDDETGNDEAQMTNADEG